MSRIGQRSLTYEEADLLRHCGFFWPNSRVDKSSFMKILASVLNVEVQLDIQTERWEEELTASGACNASGEVDVTHFVALRLLGVEGAETVQSVLSRPQQENWRVAGPSGRSNEMLAAVNNKAGGPNHPSGGDMSSSSWTLSTAVIGEQSRLPSPEDQAGALVVVNSK
eukprot:2380899-Amphidinium_carterae.1